MAVPANCSVVWHCLHAAVVCCPVNGNEVDECLKSIGVFISFQDDVRWHAVHSIARAPCGEFCAVDWQTKTKRLTTEIHSFLFFIMCVARRMAIDTGSPQRLVSSSDTPVDRRRHMAFFTRDRCMFARKFVSRQQCMIKIFDFP